MIDTALDLFAREGAIVVLLGLLGSGPAAALPGATPAVARVALAPAFGLALGAGVMLTASQLISMSTGAWLVLVPLCVISGAFAARAAHRAGRRERSLPAAHLVAAAAALIVPLAILNAPLVDQRTIGPGGYFIADAAGYSEQSFVLDRSAWGAERFHANLDASGRSENRFLHDFYEGSLFQTGTAPLQSALNETFGWRAVDSQSALLAALVAIGSLGCFALLLTATGAWWAALVASILFAGPVVYQLYIDASQAALAALALIGPLALAGGRLAAAPVRAGLLFGLLAAGAATVYPSYAPILVGGVLVGAGLGLARERRGRAGRRTATAACVCAAAAALVVAPVGLAKDVSYARALSNGLLEESYGEAATGTPLRTERFGAPVPSPPFVDILPRWEVPAEAVPAWLSGSRDIYYLPTPGEISLPRWAAFGLLFPALLVTLAALGALRFPATRVLLGVAALSPVVAAYGFLVQDCDYCGQRNLLPLAAVGAILAGAGLAAGAPTLLRRAPRAGIVVLGGLAAVILVVSLQRDSVLARRLTEGGALVGKDLRAVLSEAATRRQTIAVEGSGAGPPHAAPIESALLHSAEIELFKRPPVVDWHSLPSFFYFPDDPPRDADLDPRYRLVLTRLAGVRTPRRIVFRSGPYALQRRLAPLDATIASGAVTDLAQRDRSGAAWVAGPLTLTVAAPGRSAPVYVRMSLRGPAARSLRAARGTRVLGRSGDSVRICAPVRGGEIRRGTLRLRFDRGADQPPPDTYGLVPVPAKALRIASLQATGLACGAGQSEVGRSSSRSR